MKLTFSITFIALSICINIAVGAEVKCNQIPREAKLMVDCCKFPEFNDKSVQDKIRGKFPKSDSKNELLRHCQMNEAYFKELKIAEGNSSLNIEKAAKHIESSVNDEKWKNVLKSGVTRCVKEIEERRDEIYSIWEKIPQKIQKSQCDALYISFSMCMHCDAFLNCPADVWKDSKSCEKGKNWLNQCRHDVEAWTLYEDSDELD